MVIPEEILKDFVLSKIDEQDEILTLTLIESVINVPLSEKGVKLVQNGYQNAIEIPAVSLLENPKGV